MAPSYILTQIIVTYISRNIWWVINQRFVTLSKDFNILINKIKKYRYFIASRACRRGNIDVIKSLALEGFDILENYDSLFMIAAGSGKKDIIEYFVSIYPHSVKRYLKSHVLPLIAATSRGEISVVKYLVELGADPQDLDDDVMDSIANNDVIDYLIEYGASPPYGWLY